MLQEPKSGSQELNGASRLLPRDRFKGTLGNRVYQSLQHAILTLAYRPGEIIRKPEICDFLGVSRSPVADAVARLATDGLVDVEVGKVFVESEPMESIPAGGGHGNDEVWGSPCTWA